ncbi:hypothetical protein LCGC14_2005380, partial [marine sediment metagenome]
TLDREAVLDEKITQIRNTVQGSTWGFIVASHSIVGDGYLGDIQVAFNYGLDYVSSGSEAARGFLDGSVIQIRRFEFENDAYQASVFKAPGLTHINVFIEAVYTGINGGPFGVSGTSYIELGVAVETGINTIHTNEAYAIAKTIVYGVLPSNSVTERYVASIPTSLLNLSDNVMFNIVPRIRITNSRFIDGGPGADPEPTVQFDHIRVVTSSYSIAGNITNEDGSSSALATTVGEVL